MIIQMYKGKEERTECKNYRSICLLSVVGKFVDRVCRVTEGLIDDEQGVSDQ